VGHSGEVTARDNAFADTKLYIEDADAIGKMDRKEAEEVSCGYTCRLDRTPGTWNGQAYDAVQRGHRGNHIAIGPKGWGRMGSDVKMHLDSGEAVSGVEGDSYVPPVSTTPQTPAAPAGQAPGGNPASTPTNDAAELRGRLAAVEAENTRLKADAEKRNDAATKQAEKERFDAAVKARVALVALAAPVLGAAWKDDGLTDDDVRRAVLTKLEPSVLELPEAKADAEGAEAFIAGAFRAAIVRADRATKALGDTRLASPGAKGTQVPRSPASKTATKGDAASGPPDQGSESDDLVADASEARDTREKDRWKTPAARRGGK